MVYQLEFERIFRDDRYRDEILLPVTLNSGEHRADFEAQIDMEENI